MRSRLSRHRAAALLLAASVGAFTGACGATPTPWATPMVTPSPSPHLSPEEIAQAVRFRVSTGLRSDEAWVRVVAADPRSDTEAYGLPLTAAEVADLSARVANADAIADVIDAYAQRQPDYAGLYIDQLRQGTVTVRFTGDPAPHVAAISALVAPGARWRVEPARWTVVDLEMLRREVDDQEAWFTTIGVAYDGTALDVRENRVSLRISSDNPAAPQLVLDHFRGADWLRVESDGVGPWTGGYGVLRVRVVSATGGPPPKSATCELEPDRPISFTLGDSGIGISNAGFCGFSRVPATDYDIVIVVHDGRGGRELGRGRASVLADAVTEVVVTVDE